MKKSPPIPACPLGLDPSLTNFLNALKSAVEVIYGVTEENQSVSYFGSPILDSEDNFRIRKDGQDLIVEQKERSGWKMRAIIEG